MPISFPPLHRAPLAPGTTLEDYRKSLADAVTRFDRDPAEASRRVLSEIVEIGSLQSEGYQKRDVNDAKQSKCTYEEFEAMQRQLQGDRSTLPRLLSEEPLDDESRAVVADIAVALAEKAGSAEGFFFQPVSSSGSVLCGRATRSDDKAGLLQVFNVALHDTPGLDGGLMLITPLTSREIASSAAEVQRTNQTRPGIYLNEVEQGWQMLK